MRFARTDTRYATFALAYSMEIAQKHKASIEQIINEIECPKDFVCYESGFENLGKTEAISGGEIKVKLFLQIRRLKFP